MNDEALLNEFSNVTVATIYNDRVDLTYTLDDRLSGSDFYPKVEEGCYYIVDIQDDYEITYLADNLADALKSLNKYDNYFNDYPNDGNFLSFEDYHDDYEPWATDFEYSIRSADEFKDIVNDMQNELKGEY